MDRLVQRRLALTVVMLMPVFTVATEKEETAGRERAISPRVAGMLAAVMPKYEAPPPEKSAAEGEPADQAGRAAGNDPGPANTIVRLPSYLVREPRLPAAEEVMTKQARERLAMQKYLGDEDGLERVMNMFSFAGLWAKIPVLGKHPFVVGQFAGRHSGPAVGPRTNEQRALDRYEKEKAAERWEQLSSLLSPQLKPDATAPKP